MIKSVGKRVSMMDANKLRAWWAKKQGFDGKFVRDQLGDARSFSLDSPESRAPRIQSLRS